MSSPDLCRNCSFQAACAYTRNSTQPVIFCEEFFCGESAQGASRVPDPASWAPARPAQRRQDLCMNCSHTVYCALKQPGAPVDFCDEYR